MSHQHVIKDGSRRIVTKDGQIYSTNEPRLMRLRSGKVYGVTEVDFGSAGEDSFVFIGGVSLRRRMTPRARCGIGEFAG